MSGTLYVVATPIGNLADAGARALEVLRSADLVACEDTRTSRTLLAHHGIATRAIALHQHNERSQSGKIVEMMLQGRSIALVSDAGTPGMSDPGAVLVEAAHRAGVRVVPIPGPSAAVAAYSVSGFLGGFVFKGFVDKKHLKELDPSQPVILYEAPHRVAATVKALLEHFGPEREIVIARELTKKFEEVARMTLAEAPAWLEGPHRQDGEFVLVLGPAKAEDPEIAEGMRVFALLSEKLSTSDAARLASEITGVPRNRLYKSALKPAK